MCFNKAFYIDILQYEQIFVLFVTTGRSKEAQGGPAFLFMDNTSTDLLGQCAPHPEVFGATLDIHFFFFFDEWIVLKH